MKKYFTITIVLLFLTLFFLVNNTKTFAYSGGLINGLSMNKGIDAFSTSVTVVNWTDTSLTTSTSLSPYSTGATSQDTAWYSFPENVDIQSFTIKIDNNYTISFYNSANTLMFSTGTLPARNTGGIITSISPLYGVKKVTITSTGSPLMYDFDVFGVVSTPVPTPTPTPTPTPIPDTIPPANVSGLTNFVTLTSASLGFTTPADADFSKYKIYQNGSLVYTSAVGITKNSPMAYTASFLSSSTTYLYKVTTVDTTGNESAGVTTSATTLTPDTTPPANVSALLVTNIAYTFAALDFITPADSDFSRYKIYQNGSLIFTSIPGVQKSYLTSYPITGLSASTTYSFKVTTLDSIGNESIGQTVSLTTLTPDLTPPAIPTNLVITGANGSANFTWNAVSDSDLKGYFLYKDGVRIFTTPITATNFNLSGLVTDQNYDYTISSIDLSGNESAKSAVYPYISLDTVPPAVPFGLNVVVSDASVSIGWNAVSNPDLAGYYVYQDGIKISSLIIDNIYTVNGLTNMQNYHFKVSSVDATANESLLSSSVQAMPIPAPDTKPPDVPTGLVLSPLDEQIQLTWSKVLNVDLLGYYVYRDGIKLNSTPLNYNKYIDNSVTNSVYYSYQISSIDHSGNESFKSASFNAAPIPSNVPKVHVNFSLLDLIRGIENWFSSIWLLLAFCIAIPLAFYIATRIKTLY